MSLKTQAVLGLLAMIFIVAATEYYIAEMKPNNDIPDDEPKTEPVQSSAVTKSSVPTIPTTIVTTATTEQSEISLDVNSAALIIIAIGFSAGLYKILVSVSHRIHPPKHQE